MSVDILVKTGQATLLAPDIVDPLISEVFVGIERGAAYLDRVSTLKKTISYRLLYHDGLRLGNTILIHDDYFAKVLYGKLISITHTYDGVEAYSDIEIEAFA